jgi:hypothetical protein
MRRWRPVNAGNREQRYGRRDDFRPGCSVKSMVAALPAPARQSTHFSHHALPIRAEYARAIRSCY